MSVHGFCDNKCKHEVYTKEEVDTVLKETVQGYNENSKINIEMTFRKSGNVVTVVGSLKINENEGNADGVDLIRFTNDTSLIETNNTFGYITIPDFAKTNESSDNNICLVHVNTNANFSTTNLKVYDENLPDVIVATRVFGCYFCLQKMKNYSDRYTLQGTLGFNVEAGCTYNFSFSYIVE